MRVREWVGWGAHRGTTEEVRVSLVSREGRGSKGGIQAGWAKVWVYEVKVRSKEERDGDLDQVDRVKTETACIH